MKSGHKALGVLLVLCGLFLNPIILSKLFSNDGNISSSSIIIGVVCLELLIVLFGVTIYKFNSSLLSSYGIAVLSVIFTIGFTIGFDRLYGAFMIPETANLLFPPFSRAGHNTAEFNLEVQINNLGFRGSNTTIKKKKKRVVVIGDSFTFGWGVESQQTWIHHLSEAYPEFEFLNLGQGGNHPGDYVRVAKRAIPRLKPDLVFVGILQGNDLHQLMRVIGYEEAEQKHAIKAKGAESKTEKYLRYIRIVYPNFSKRFPAAVSIRMRWKGDSETLLSELTTEQLKKYVSIEPELRSWFEEGLLNPSLIYESLHHPNMLTEAADSSNPLYKKGLMRLQDHLAEIADVCEHNQAKFLVLDLPNRPYGFPETTRSFADMGYIINGCDTLDASIATETSASRLGIGLIQSKITLKNSPLFFNFDGHWNVEGNRIFAQELIKSLEKNPTWKNF